MVQRPFLKIKFSVQKSDKYNKVHFGYITEQHSDLTTCTLDCPEATLHGKGRKKNTINIEFNFIS